LENWSERGRNRNKRYIHVTPGTLEPYNRENAYLITLSK
jgi:hypothetical protein